MIRNVVIYRDVICTLFGHRRSTPRILHCRLREALPGEHGIKYIRKRLRYGNADACDKIAESHTSLCLWAVNSPAMDTYDIIARAAVESKPYTMSMSNPIVLLLVRVVSSKSVVANVLSDQIRSCLTRISV